ncbi:MAG: hypothetical protein K0R17_3845 [Rariglobus sp.]|nr:hypothetical protein [Rariglobus sp.]
MGTWVALAVGSVAWLLVTFMLMTERSANITFNLGFGAIKASEATWAGRLTSVGVITAAFVVLGAFLLLCARLFRRYEQGVFFDPVITRTYRWLSWLVFVSWTAGVVVPLVMFATAGGMKASGAVLDFNFGYLLGAIWLYLISRVMAEGERLQDEAAFTV